MGHYFCDTILDYCDPDQSKVATALRELQLLYPARGAASSATAPEDDSCVPTSSVAAAYAHALNPRPRCSDGSDFGDTTESDAKRKWKRRGKRATKASKPSKGGASGSNGSARRGRTKTSTPSSHGSGRRRSDTGAAKVCLSRGWTPTLAR